MIGLIGATLTVASTTIDDAVWLVPYVTSPSIPFRTRVIHAITFICTLEALTCACVIIALCVKDAVLALGDKRKEEIVLGATGAAICWVIALFIYVKKVMKRRRKKAAAAAAAAENTKTNDTILTNNYGSVESGSNPTTNNTNTMHNDKESSSSSSSESGDTENENGLSPHPSIGSVICFTSLGALDEISYFPALVVGQVFSPFELCFGTFLAACLILIIIIFFLARCKPFIDFLDTIPLYGIISFFALALTISVIIEMIRD